VIVACAGENDLGNGVALDTSVSALETFLGVVFDDAIGEDSEKKNRMNHHYVIFLGPKFEPWLEDDPSYKKKYSKMSRSFDRCFQRHSNADNIHYIDCLTMFCTGETANIPGAILGGKAKADYKYFASDRLHLSSHGYKLWKEVVERQINKTMSF
jgi:lysophospholipase L1-like esterase